mgnify:FL=1|jgi:hypothetical protein
MSLRGGRKADEAIQGRQALNKRPLDCFGPSGLAMTNER